MAEINEQKIVSDTTFPEPPVCKGGERIARVDVVKAIGALEAYNAAASDSGWDGYCPPGDIVEKDPVKRELSFPEKMRGDADALMRHTITNEAAYPWRTIGKIFVYKDSNFNNAIWTGSGVMVGRNLLLTAGHVAPWGVNAPGMKFIPAFKNGAQPYGIAYVLQWYGYHQDGEVNGRDYVICKLDRNIGDTIGWMGYQWWSGQDDQYTGRTWTSVGYPNEPANPGANYMLVEDNVAIVDVDDEGSDGKELESNMYSLPGWSGGPLWNYIGGQPRVIGVMSGDETDFLQPRHTVSAGGRAMGDLVIYGQNYFTL